jgi:hypothetical protein
MPPPPSLTPAQLSLQAERKALKEAKKAAAQAAAKEIAGSSSQALISDSDRAKFLQRDWTGYSGQQKSLRLVTWNVCEDYGFGGLR